MQNVSKWGGLRLLLATGVCLGTLATANAAGGASPQAAQPLNTSPLAVSGGSLSQVLLDTVGFEVNAADQPVRPAAMTEAASQQTEPAGTVRPAVAPERVEPSVTVTPVTPITSETGTAETGTAETPKPLPAELPYADLPNYRRDRLDRYLAWAEENPEDTAETTVLRVNMDQDQDFYSLIWEVSDPDSLAVLVNKHYALPAWYVPKLEALGSRYGTGSLQPEAAQAFRTMADAARKDGFTLRSVSAYRSYATQKSLYNRYLKLYKQTSVDTFSARPGHSEHQTGLALDINVASTSAHFENTATFAWLKAHCAEYGFILRYGQEQEPITGYRFEPWHYRYVGVEAAAAIMEQGITYEEYLALQPVLGT